MKLVCQHCSNEWNYQGNNPHYATCSKCHNLVSIKKHKVSKYQDDEIIEDEETKKVDEFLLKNKDVDISNLKSKEEQKPEQPKETVKKLTISDFKSIFEEGICSSCNKENNLVATRNDMKFCSGCVLKMIEGEHE